MKRDAGLDGPPVGSETEALAWANLYALLSACFAPPTLELLDAAREGALAETLVEAVAGLRVERAAFEGALHGFETLSRQPAPASPRGAMEALEVEHARLLVGPGLPVAPPYESVWVDREDEDIAGPLWGDSTLAVRDAYRQAGLTARSGHEPPDHLAAELEFMALLWQREAHLIRGQDARAVEGAREHRAHFLSDHLRCWAPLMAARVVEEAQHPLYRAAARLLQAVLSTDTSGN
jgi:TorA maturation chaperone TorD